MQQIRDSVRSGTKVDFARLMNWPSDQSNPSYAFGNVNRQMNFIGNADRDGQPAQDLYPNFIQFRQARGSLDATDVERWVEFCCRLVWLAGLIAEDPAEALPFSQWFASVAGNGAIQRSGSRLSILDLLSRMNFPADTTMYWKERIAKFACYTPGDADDRVDDELPPAGYTYPSQGPGGAGGGGGGGDGGAGPLRDPPGDDEDDEDDDGDNGDNASPSRRVNINPTSRKRPAPHRGETPAQKIQRKADWRRGRVRTPSPPPSRPPTPEIAGRRLPPGGRGTAPKETPINKDARQIAIELNQAVRRALAAELEAQRLAREGVDAAEIERRRREAEAATDRERLRLAAAAAETEAEVEAAREMRRLRDEARVAEETERLRLAAEAAAEDPEAAEETERLRVAAAEAAVSTQPTDVRLEDGTLVYIPDDFYNGTMGLNPDAITEVSGLRILWDDLGGPPKKPTAGQDAAAPALTLNPGESDTSLRRRCIRAAIQQIIDAFVASERAAAAIQSAAEAAAARQDLEDAASERSARPDLDLQVPAEGMIAPVGVIAEEEEMRFDGFSWQVANFNLNRWNIRDVSSRITNRAGTERRGVCGIRSVIEAMRLQYPDDPLGQITPVALLERFTEMRRTSGERPNALITDVELNQLLFEWTGGRYSVVVYDMNAEFPEELRAARRVGTPEEQARQSRNLFLIYGPHTDGAIGNEGGHWQALQRK
ncbi:uncharacterized protein LY89DRAFT_786661 [Mollisia scopiformis]|uniref:Uncharacterized protein n=1 Tax=Mollisia scopiformis TaxID=149040 RepID=A0A194WTR0_MOLSC|nr:uncharacterized protein LY89DRAFT_786661 [Mollisia scopiformis]KUJ10997.1 hypothetical protein LY89DRAFT_786661 [Mollisia scopiformis]